MRLHFILVAVVFCGVCSAIPTDSVPAAATASASSTGVAGAIKAALPVSTTASSTTSSASSSASSPSSSASSPSSSASSSAPSTSVGGDEDDDDDDDDELTPISGGGLGLPLSSAILLSSHHGHHVCLPDVVAFSLLGGHNYPLGPLFPYHHTSPQKLQQELMFLKAFTKAGQHVWKTIASGHVKYPYQGLGNIAKVAGAISSGVNAFAGKGTHGPGGIVGGISSGLSSAAQHLIPGH